MRRRILAALRRAGMLPGDDALEEAQTPDSPLLAACQAASVQGLVAMGPQAGRRVERRGRDPRLVGLLGLDAAGEEGFSLHAWVRVAARDRDRLERLVRYVSRPPVARERLSLSGDGRVCLELRRPFRDGSTHVLFAPMTFLEKLAALVPAPHFNLVSYHGVLAPNAAWRREIVPAPGPRPPRRETLDTPIDPVRRARRKTWAELMKRVFAIDVLRCPQCRSRRAVIALLTDAPVVRAILECLGLPCDPPPIHPARPPPIEELLAMPEHQPALP